MAAWTDGNADAVFGRLSLRILGFVQLEAEKLSAHIFVGAMSTVPYLRQVVKLWYG